MKFIAQFGLAALLIAPVAQCQSAGVVGEWREGSGSIIRIAPCADALCATLIQISSAAPTQVDGNNPDASLRSRSLCGLQIGQGFRGSDPNRAEGGKLYDPRNGKTYKGNMTSDGKTLLLRGYIGVSMFGRTAKWDRVTTPVQSCTADPAAAAPGSKS